MAVPRLLIDSKDLNKSPVIQNEIGVYYWNEKAKIYFKPILEVFNGLTKLPKGFKKYGPKPTQEKPAGSHWSTDYQGENIRSQMAIDFGVPRLQLSRLTSSVDWKLEAVSGIGIFKTAKWTTGKKIFGISRYTLFTVHIRYTPKIGTVVKAGKTLCTVYFDHFHLFIKRFGLPYPIRNLVLAED